MRLTRIYFAICTSLLLVAPTTFVSAQDKQKAGTTVEAWREALPNEAEAQPREEATLEVAASLPSADETRKALLSSEQRLMDSLKTRDADSLSEILSGDFMFASPRMVHVKDRQTYLEFALRDLRLTDYEFSEPAVRIFGRMAIVSSRLKQKATVKGEDSGGNYLITDVWLNRNGVWRIVSRHESFLAATK